MNHMNELVLNLLVQGVPRLLNELLHAVNNDDGDEDPAKFELSLILTEFFCDLEILLSVICHRRDNFGSDLVLLSFTQ
jgi:hypothetical protein